MNSTPKIPGYEVIANDPTDKSRTITRTFIHPVLLMARRNALQFVQELNENKQRSHALDTVIQLIELDRTRIPASQKIICTVFQQRFNHVGEQPQPPNIPLDAVWNGLEEMDRENEYYQEHGYEKGFGCVEMSQIMERNLLAQTEDISTLTARFFTVLYDGFAYSASLISHFNNQVKDDEVICFCTDFMLNH